MKARQDLRPDLRPDRRARAGGHCRTATVLGIAHTLWNQIPSAKDYISVPKGNMYSEPAHHRDRRAQDALPFEIQIRTWRWHRVGRVGVAAHWRYKERRAAAIWTISSIGCARSSTGRARQPSLSTAETDLFSEEVLLSYPQGRHREHAARPIDFAYRIHSGGATLRGRGHLLHRAAGNRAGDGRRVEITSALPPRPEHRLAARGQNPAGHKIRQFLKRELRGENVVKGRDMLEGG